jgi:putative membrane protein
MTGERCSALLPPFGESWRRCEVMWGCGYFPYFSWMGGVFPGGIFSFLMWALIILALVYLAIRISRSLKSGQTEQNRDREDSLEILKVRYARGELGHEEYAKMKNTLLHSL